MPGLITKLVAHPLFQGKFGWNLINFEAKVGSSNVLSFLLRPLAVHPHLRLGLGVVLVVTAISFSFSSISPFSSTQDIGGPADALVLDAGEPVLKTTVAIRKPLESIEISQRFWALHTGVDMRAPVGTAVWAVMPGTVKEAQNTYGGYGKLVVVTHDNGFESWYAHLSKIKVSVGQIVTTETQIGDVGSTGRSTGPHLHFEIRENGRTVNPAPIIGLKNIGPTYAVSTPAPLATR